MDGKKADTTGQRFSVSGGKAAEGEIGKVISRRKRMLLALKKGRREAAQGWTILANHCKQWDAKP